MSSDTSIGFRPVDLFYSKIGGGYDIKIMSKKWGKCGADERDLMIKLFRFCLRGR